MERKVFQGERLKSARLFRGKTLTELASETGISKQSLSLYENNGNKPEYEKCELIASALNFPSEFFFYKDNTNVLTEVTYFRSLLSATKMSRIMQSTKLDYVTKIYNVLQNYIDFPALTIPQISFDTNYDILNEKDNERMIEDIELIAETLREEWGLGDDPIDDLQYLLEENGIVVTGFDTTNNKIDAFSQRTVINNGEVYFICVDQGIKPNGRIRFDMAHELGHILLHPWSENIELVSKEEFKLREKQANIFASAFLLPRKSFGNDVSAYPTDLKYYLSLKNKWKSSIQSMIYRSNQLGLITVNQYQYLMKQISKQGWRTHEPGDTPHLLNENIFQGAIDVLFENHIFTPASFLDLLAKHGINLYPSEIENLLHLKPGTLLILKENGPKVLKLKPLNNDCG